MMRDALYRLNEMYYSSVDRENELLEKGAEFFAPMLMLGKREGEETSINGNNQLSTLYQSALFQSNNFLQPLFEKVICKTKDIAVEEY